MKLKYTSAQIRKLAHNAIEKFEQNKENEFFEIVDDITKRSNISLLRVLGEEIGKAGKESPERYFALLNKLLRRDREYSYDPNLLKLYWSKLKWTEKNIDAWVYGGRTSIVGSAFTQMRKDNYWRIVEVVEKYIKHFQSWYVCDSFCHHPMAKIIMEHPDYILPILRKWAQSENKWLRRESAVYLHAFFAENSDQEITRHLEILDMLMQDKDKDVKKGVGWALREMTKNYEKELLDFIGKWIESSSKDTKWIIEDGIKKLNNEKQEEILKKMISE